ncbi:MAG: hypothetical protein ACRBN8_41000 [Nannocystales bacterium]
MKRWLDVLDRGMDKVTSEALRVTDQARKVAGIGVGTIAIRPRGSHTDMGGQLDGVVELQLAESTELDGVSLTLVAQQKRMGLSQGPNGKRSPVQRTVTLYSQELPLAGAGTYRGESFSFSIRVPSQLEERLDADGALGDVLKFAQGVQAMTRGPVLWSLNAVAAVPWKRNVRSTVDVSID